MDSKQLLKSFIIGSSIPAFIILFIVVIYLFKIKEATFDYYRYSVLAPIGMGLLSLIAKFISIKYNISLQICYFIVSLFSALFVSINISRGEKAYNFKSTIKMF